MDIIQELPRNPLSFANRHGDTLTVLLLFCLEGQEEWTEENE